MSELIIKIVSLKDSEKGLGGFGNRELSTDEVAQLTNNKLNIDRAIVLQGGMKSGKSSITLALRDELGVYSITEISADILDGLNSAVKGADQRWADEENEEAQKN